MMAGAPVTHDVVLVGGGHSHALFIRRWAMTSVEGVRITLVSKDVLTPYSGMLPGYIAGHYSHDDIHIDLLSLCSWAGVRFIKAEMIGIDLNAKAIKLKDRPDVQYDILALDTGSTPTLDVPGAKEFVTPVKPVSDFISRWNGIQSSNIKNMGVVGGGAGGYELVMAMAHRNAASDEGDKPGVTIHWFLRGELPLSDRPRKVGQFALEHAARIGVKVHFRFDVKKVTHQVVHANDGRQQAFDELLWCTAASAPNWPAKAGLDTDSRGFVATSATLQSTSNPEVFATGDIGTQINTPSAKAGVFAVRQAPVLYKNIKALVQGRALKIYRPQKDFLSLISTGDKFALGSRSGFSFNGPWVWRLKDSIDQKFMNKFLHLPVLSMSSTKSVNTTLAEARCNGCGAKVPADILSSVLSEFPSFTANDVQIVSGVEQGDDAAEVLWTNDHLVQSVDQIRALFDDPYLFGQVAALHALSDIYAHNAKAHSAQLLLTVPFASAQIVNRELLQLMTGISTALRDAGCSIIGGHTAEGAELQVGLVINGYFPNREKMLLPGDYAHVEPVAEEINRGSVAAHSLLDSNTRYVLVLTQPIGIGVLFAGLMQGKARGVDVDAAKHHMLQSNQAAAKILHSHGMTHCTDITGFGLLGHLHRMVEREAVTCTLIASKVPVLDGAVQLAQQEVKSSLSSANQRVLEQISGSNALDSVQRVLLTDPQTSGGLLAVVPESNAQQCVQALVTAGYLQAVVVGTAVSNDEHASIVAGSESPGAMSNFAKLTVLG